jgi:hypothetical protein
MTAVTKQRQKRISTEVEGGEMMISEEKKKCGEII